MPYEDYMARTEALIEALPFIQRYRGQIILIKYGGSAMEDEDAVERLLRDVVFMEAVGIKPVLIHGGGKAISARMREAGQKPRFVNGLRVTDGEAIAIVEETLDRSLNPMLVQQIVEFGGKPVGLSGRDVFRATKLPPQKEGKAAPVDLGFVGEVIGVETAPVRAALEDEKIPVISPIGATEDGVVLNVNADVAAGALAGEIGASKLIYLSDVMGIMRDPKDKESLIPTVDRAMIDKLLDDEVIQGGMIPKVQSAVSALGCGVQKVHLIDGRIPHSLLLEIFTNSGVGTEIVP
jgi:acetylglutamate kinase